ncbi:hypothetical protein Sfum_3962 [Syntrophobacter fumaroxidans MPOB]|uniref:Uncharacterized protein n=1 Tax=Syntrophobacter fumaroxidans (strain DSM 10017 / MPOB) TaxID=335543 RepID=A0LQC7_SYNFM|nr:hypothetical protein Sfum_3962 [Syntrophobacter fumaroxidans MPOB]
MIQGPFPKECVVLACIKPLPEDDGFGPALAARLHVHPGSPGGTVCIEAGTAGLRFNLLLVDGNCRRTVRDIAVDEVGEERGKISGIDCFLRVKPMVFARRRFRNVNMLKAIRARSAQIVHIPQTIRGEASRPPIAATRRIWLRLPCAAEGGVS